MITSPPTSKGRRTATTGRRRLLWLLLLALLAVPFRGGAWSLSPTLHLLSTSRPTRRLCLSTTSSKSNSSPSSGGASNNSIIITIQVCQNKDCCQKWLTTTQTPLPVVLQDLLSHASTGARIITIETTGCLSQCDQGPNLSIVTTTGTTAKDEQDVGQVYLHRLVDPARLADAVQEYFSSTSSGSGSSLLEIPTTLRAAVKVMEQAIKAKDPAEQDRFLSSVIRVLVQATTTMTTTNDNSDDNNNKDGGKSNVIISVPLYTQSSALARAYALRAQAKLDQGWPDDALQDARAALEIISSPTTTSTTTTTTTSTTASRRLPLLSSSSSSRQWITTRVYRVMVDAYQAKGQIPQAMDSLQQWAVVDPTFSTKIIKEMTRLRQLLL